MLQEVKQEYNVCYILTQTESECIGKLIQPTKRTWRLRVIILGRTGVVQNKANTIVRNSREHYIVGEILKKSGIPLLRNTENDEPKADTDSGTNSLSTKDSVIALENPTTLEEDGTQYLAGWITHKLRTSHLHLGQHSHILNKTVEHTYSMPKNTPDWANHLSYGDLIVPTAEFLN